MGTESKPVPVLQQNALEDYVSDYLETQPAQKPELLSAGLTVGDMAKKVTFPRIIGPIPMRGLSVSHFHFYDPELKSLLVVDAWVKQIRGTLWRPADSVLFKVLMVALQDRRWYLNWQNTWQSKKDSMLSVKLGFINLYTNSDTTFPTKDMQVEFYGMVRKMLESEE